MRHSQSVVVFNLLVVVCFVTVVVLAIFQLHKIQPPSAAVIEKFSVAEFLISDGAAWEETHLPHDWHMERLNHSQLRYRLLFNLSSSLTELYAVYLPVISQNAVAYLNGSEVGNGGSTEAPLVRNWPRPLIFPIASEYFVDGKNVLELHVFSGPAGKGFVPVVYLGKWTDLVPSYNYRKLLKQTALAVFVIVLVTCAFFLFSIVWYRADSPEYAWAGATFLGLAGNISPAFFEHLSISIFLMDWWQRICFGYTILFILFFVNRYFKISMKGVETSASVVVISLSIVCFLLGSTSELRALYFNFGPGLWGLCNLAIGSIPIMAALRIAIAQENKAALFIVCVGCVMFVLGIHDTLMAAGYLSREDGYLIQYISPLVALLLLVILISRLIETSDDLESLNSSLEQRIKDSNSALAESYQKVQKMEQERILALERERFNRDMHDGLGGHLSTALALAETDVGPHASLTQTIRDATEEMRLMMDAAGAMGEDIGIVVGSLRQKLQRQAEAAGYQLIWNIEDTSPIGALGHSGALNLIRIVQEAVTNAVRHSGGDTIQVVVKDVGRFVVLEVKDNGSCTNFQRDSGNGIANMEKRAKELGAQIYFIERSDFGGFAVKLSIPVNSRPDNG